MTFFEKLQEREFQSAIVAVLLFVLSLFGITPDHDTVDKAVTGVVAAVVLAAFIINRAIVKKADAHADAAVEAAVSHANALVSRAHIESGGAASSALSVVN